MVKEKTKIISANSASKMEAYYSSMSDAIKEWDKKKLVDLVLTARNDGLAPIEIVNDILYPELLKACEDQKTFDLMFSELLLLSDTIQGALDILIPEIRGSKTLSRPKGTIVIGTVEGDIHDFGEKLVAAYFYSGGYNVINLGRDVHLEKFIETAETENADVIAVSALMTPAIMNMRRLFSMIRDRKMNIRTMIGGLATSMTLAQEIGADAWAGDAVTGLSMLSKIIN